MTLAWCVSPRVSLVLALYLILLLLNYRPLDCCISRTEAASLLCQGSDAPNSGMIWNKHVLKI